MGLDLSTCSCGQARPECRECQQLMVHTADQPPGSAAATRTWWECSKCGRRKVDRLGKKKADPEVRPS